ncbi:unnamed protein product, partial [Aureobasidium uvarum]
MSSRNRQPRASLNQDADEERRLWTMIRDGAKKIDSMVAALLDELSDMTLDDRLESLYRENVKISEEVSHIIDGKSDEMSLLDSIKILAAMREASEETLHMSRSHSRNATLKRKAGSMDVDDEASGTGSPRPGPTRQATTDRLAVAEGKSRERNRERKVSVKLEDGAESVASSVEANEPRTSRLQLSLGAHVFYRNKGRTQEGEGILCRVTNVIGEGKQRRYEIQDADPDPVPGGELPPPYRASVAHLMPIPTENKGLADLNKGRHVLAQYPDTTTFYKAEVSANWRSKDLALDRGDYVRLSFEGDEMKVMEVERRFVLAEKER